MGRVRESGDRVRDVKIGNALFELMLKITQFEYENIRRHGEETYPHECCGVLLGHAEESHRKVEKTVRCGNTRSDSPHNRYHIAPHELVRIQRQAREAGQEIVGFYHSHPDHPARWSQTDFAEAHWIGCSYVITSVERSEAKITNSFLLAGETEENKRFEDEPVLVGLETAAMANESKR
ncbi:MAG TPA: M67 family metallopeptidase [Terriglobales bacterium]|jgi:proteasome lid subunit RPN8/RPN11|nr:M67 family metallopeptidase [Terriglobales bacterium]